MRLTTNQREHVIAFDWALTGSQGSVIFQMREMAESSCSRLLNYKMHLGLAHLLRLVHHKASILDSILSVVRLMKFSFLKTLLYLFPKVDLSIHYG